MNPARSLGRAISGGIWTAHWIFYWVAPILSMIAAARAYDFLRLAGMPEMVPRGVPFGVQGPLEAPAAERELTTR